MKIALVTGGSSGIGKEIVLSLLNNNYNVAVTGRSMDKLIESYKEISNEHLHFIETNVMQIEKYQDVIYSVCE